MNTTLKIKVSGEQEEAKTFEIIESFAKQHNLKVIFLETDDVDSEDVQQILYAISYLKKRGFKVSTKMVILCEQNKSYLRGLAETLVQNQGIELEELVAELEEHDKMRV